jgi:hypothetical protein
LLVSLPGYRSELRLDTGVQVSLWGSLPEFSRFPPVFESAAIVHANPAFDVDLTVVRGRVLLSNLKAGEPARVRARFHEEIWDLVLQDNTTKVSLELVGLVAPFTRERGAEAPEASLALWVLEGRATLSIRDQKEVAMQAPTLFLWDNLGPNYQGPHTRPRAPEWWTAASLPTPRESRPVIQALEELSKRVTGKAPVEVVLSEAIRDPDAGLRALVVRSLVAVGSVPRLLDALDDEKHIDVRVYAIEGLRHWLGLAPVHDQVLRGMLVNQKQYSQQQAEMVIQLLHGFTDRDAADPVLRGTLVEYLNNDRLPIRQLAHWQLVQMVPDGQKIRFDPAGDSAQREAGQEQWRRLVSRAPAKPGGPRP